MPDLPRVKGSVGIPVVIRCVKVPQHGFVEEVLSEERLPGEITNGTLLKKLVMILFSNFDL